MQCSGYKVNDNKFNTSLSKFFKIPSFEDINKSLKINHKTIVKRGCSEFTLKYPDYKITDSTSKSFFKYNHEWQKKENIINEFYPKNISSELNPRDTLKGNSLNDMITIKNWINYAESINDYSFKKLT